MVHMVLLCHASVSRSDSKPNKPETNSNTWNWNIVLIWLYYKWNTFFAVCIFNRGSNIDAGNVVYNLRGVLLPRQWNKTIFAHKVHLHGSSGTIPRRQKNLFQGGATNSKTRAPLEHWSATNGARYPGKSIITLWLKYNSTWPPCQIQGCTSISFF